MFKTKVLISTVQLLFLFSHINIVGFLMIGLIHEERISTKSLHQENHVGAVFV